MNKNVKLIYAIFLWMALVIFVSSADAGLSPQGTVEKLLDAIKKIKTGDNLPKEQIAANQKYCDSAIAFLDLPDVGEKTLGKYWSDRSQKEREDFVGLLSRLFERVAFPNSAKFFSELQVVYNESKVDQELAVVPLTVVHQNEGAIRIDFKLHANAGQWKVYDVVLDEVSMRNNLRNQFQRVISEHDFKELVRRMKDKLDKTSN